MAEVIEVLLDNMFDIMRSYKALFELHGPVFKSETKLFRRVMLKHSAANLRTFNRLYDEHKESIHKHALETWKTLITNFNLDLDASVHNTLQQELCPPHWKACNWFICVCRELRPCHRMKVCKGCWRVRYCCVACQQL